MYTCVYTQHITVDITGYIFKPTEEAELKPLAKRAMDDAVGCFLEGSVEVRVGFGIWREKLCMFCGWVGKTVRFLFFGGGNCAVFVSESCLRMWRGWGRR